MNVVKDVDYLTRFTIQDLIALLQAELKMFSPVKRANEDSDPDSRLMLVLRRNACVYALREKETFFPVRKT